MVRILFFLIIIFKNNLQSQFNKNLNNKNYEFSLSNDINEAQKLNFKIYPNPNSTYQINIIAPKANLNEIIILNIFGEIVFKKTTSLYQIQIPNLIGGLYIFKLKQGSKVGLRRLVIL